MSEKLTKQKVQETVRQPDHDESGVLRTSRPYTPEEAAAIDAANREQHAKARQQRFTRSGGGRSR